MSSVTSPVGLYVLSCLSRYFSILKQWDEINLLQRLSFLEIWSLFYYIKTTNNKYWIYIPEIWQGG